MTGHVYFARFGSQIKIGFTKCTATRIATHKKTQAVPVTFLFSVPGDEARERSFHKWLKKYRTNVGGYFGRTLPELFDIPEDELADIKAQLASEEGFSDAVPKRDGFGKIMTELDRPTLRKIKYVCFLKGITMQKFARDALIKELEAAQ